MSENLKLVPVKDLLKQKFFIPRYQRGYRWTQQQVKDLLDDIKEFIDSKPGVNDFYCLQPLVVKGTALPDDTQSAQTEANEGQWDALQDRLDKSMRWEVIDGQQRLTTIHILLTCLGDSCPYSITYETRNNDENSSSIFLENITKQEMLDRKESNIDFFHMAQAYETIKVWFRDKDEEFRTGFKDTLLNKIQFIWFKSDDPDPIAVFTRLNIGKIPLTDAELVKALFLNRSNFSNTGSGENIRLHQQEIAMEWDRIEFALQNDEFWLFIHAYDPEERKATRIDFILDLMFEKDKLEFQQHIIDDTKYTEADWKEYFGNDDHKTFRYFYEYFTFHKKEMQEGKTGFRLRDDIWRKIKDFFQIFNEWYNDLEMYHYIGFLIENGENITNLVEVWQKASSKKEFFDMKDEGVKAKIKDKISRCNDLTQEYETPENPKTNCRPLLLLFNLQTVINQNLALAKSEKYQAGTFYKFPFHLFKKEGKKRNNKGWEIEHIASNSGDDLENPEKQKIYLAGLRDALKLPDELKMHIDNFLGQDTPTTYCCSPAFTAFPRNTFIFD